MTAAPTFYIHLYWSEDNQKYETSGNALACYEKEIDLFLQEQDFDDTEKMKKYLMDGATFYWNLESSKPKTTFPVLKVDENNETFVEYLANENYSFSQKITCCFHDVPEDQKIRPHRVIWFDQQGKQYSEQLSFPLENEEERVMDITYQGYQDKK